MSRRPSLIAGLELPSQTSAADAAKDTSPPAKATPARKPTPDTVHTSIYLPKAAHQKLREIAFTTDRKVHDLVMEGIDEILKRHGHPPLALKPKQGP